MKYIIPLDMLAAFGSLHMCKGEGHWASNRNCSRAQKVVAAVNTAKLGWGETDRVDENEGCMCWGGLERGRQQIGVRKVNR